MGQVTGLEVTKNQGMANVPHGKTCKAQDQCRSDFLLLRSTCNNVANNRIFAAVDGRDMGMGKHLFIWVGLILLSIGFVQAQVDTTCTYQIIGTVFDAETRSPLAYVTIQLDGTQTGAISDADGAFTISNLCEEEYDLTFSYLGYKPLQHHHDFHHPEMQIYLARKDIALESIIVEATASSSALQSMSTSKLEREELANVASQSLGEVASNIAGVNTISTGQNIVKPVIHGLHSNRVLVMNNAIRHEFQNWGIEHAPEIDPSLIDQLEVIKGAATVRFGPDALGGVILVNPPPLELSSAWQGKVSLTGKSNGRSVDATAELAKGFKWLGLRAGASYLKQGDLQAPNYLLTNTGREETSYFGALRIHPLAKVDIEAYYSHFEQELGVLSGSVFSNLEDLQRAMEADTPLLTMPFSYDLAPPKQAVEHDLYKASIRYVDDHQSIDLVLGHQINQRKEFGVRRSEAPNIDLRLETTSIDLDYHHPDLGLMSGKFGLQLLTQENDNLPGTNTVPFIPNFEQHRVGAYLIESYPLSSGIIEGGIRFDYLESDIVGREPDNTIYRNNIIYRNFSGTLGIEFPLSTHTTLRSNFGTAWRAPNVAELYRFGQHSFFIEYGLWRYTIDDRFDFVSTREGILNETDRQVPAEESYKWITSLQLNEHDYQFEITAYFNRINHYIYAKPAGITRTPRGNFVFFVYDQTDAVFWGADFSSSLKHSKTLTSQLRGSILWAQQLTPKDFFANQPPPQLHYELAYHPSSKIFNNTELALSLSYYFKQFQSPRIIPVDDFLNAGQIGIERFTTSALDFDLLAPPPAYLLTHLRLTTSFKRLKVSAVVTNLFNVAYRNNTNRLRYFADEMGRNVHLGLHWQF